MKPDNPFVANAAYPWPTTQRGLWKISADALGNVFISGDTTGSLGGPNLGGYDDGIAFDGRSCTMFQAKPSFSITQMTM
jgi:hypothetical protein